MVHPDQWCREDDALRGINKRWRFTRSVSISVRRLSTLWASMSEGPRDAATILASATGSFLANLPACLMIGDLVTSATLRGAGAWSAANSTRGQFRPFVKTQKNDYLDAEAIAAVGARRNCMN